MKQRLMPDNTVNVIPERAINPAVQTVAMAQESVTIMLTFRLLEIYRAISVPTQRPIMV